MNQYISMRERALKSRGLKEEDLFNLVAAATSETSPVTAPPRCHFFRDRIIPCPPGYSTERSWHVCRLGLPTRVEGAPRKPGVICPCDCIGCNKFIKAKHQDADGDEDGDVDLPETPKAISLESSLKTGVVIGSFGLPRLIELQVRLIREHCGPVPILICDDCSDGYHHTPSGETAFAQLCRLSRDYPDVMLWSNPVRIGHAGGDLTTIWTGMQWAAARGLGFVAKISQRFLIDKRRWLQDAAESLQKDGSAVSSQQCQEGWSRFPIRSEAMIMDVKQWYRPDVLDHLRPRVLSMVDTRTAPGIAAEIVIWDTIRDRLGNRMHSWDLFGTDRQRKTHGVIWHCANSQADYLQVALRYGLRLDESFTTAGWQSQPDYKW